MPSHGATRDTPHATSRTRFRVRLLGPLALAAILMLPPAHALGESIDLGTAESFAVLAGTTVTNTGFTVVSGNLGVSPGSAVTGFPPGTVVNGTIYRSGVQPAQAQVNLTLAYVDASTQTTEYYLLGDIGGMTLTPGVYRANSSLGITGMLTLDGGGDPNAVFIFQIGSTLVTASSSVVQFIGNATACNTFWQVGSSATLGTTSTMVGTIMAQASITATTNATVEGRLLARDAAVTLDTNTITVPDACAGSTIQIPFFPTLTSLAIGVTGAVATVTIILRRTGKQI